MDDFEKFALRRRKPLFAESVDLGKDLLHNLNSRGLLPDDALEQIKAEKNVGQKASKLIDWLVESKSEKAFQEVCLALVDKYPAISKEIQTEVRIERGDVVIDDDVMKEAGVLVHRKFGTSRRFAETDKKDMTDLIAIKIQLSKEEWRHEIDQVREELHRYMDLSKQKDMSVKKIDDSLVLFIRKYETELVSKAHGMSSTTDIIMTSLDDSDYIGKLNERVKFVLTRVERVIEERDLISGEREKLKKSMEGSHWSIPTGSGSDVDTLHEQIEKYKKEVSTKDSIINRLRKMNDAFESDVEEKETQLKSLKDENLKYKDDLLELDLKLKELEAEKKVYEETTRPLTDRNSLDSAKSVNNSTSNLSVKGTGAVKPTSGSVTRKSGSLRK